MTSKNMMADIESKLEKKEGETNIRKPITPEKQDKKASPNQSVGKTNAGEKPSKKNESKKKTADHTIGKSVTKNSGKPSSNPIKKKLKPDYDFSSIPDQEIREILILKELNKHKRNPHPIRVSQEILEKLREGAKKKNILLWEYISLAMYEQLNKDDLI
jgi:hypothetical protein